ncbi:MAG TPA: nucleotide sugar dehydrogenase, partial [Chitinophagales bacterium]|nr:nucleotide sugar dehydrogenase [Chitinophagales bacterium]
NPGDQEHTITRIIKVVSGCDQESLEQIAKVYEIVVKAGVHKASSIKVAEAAKIIENTQRDLNIALMNELSRIFDKMGINTYDVIEAASTKWNFLKFYPGLVGGHCIGVDPYYLTYKADALGYDSEVILAGRRINDDMGPYVGRRTVQLMTKQHKDLSEAKVLVMGATFKENVSDIRNSKVADIVNELQQFSLKVDVVDPHADSEELKHEYGFGLREKPNGKYDAIIVAVNHNEYLDYTQDCFKEMMNENGVLVDVKGIFRKKMNNPSYKYWCL